MSIYTYVVLHEAFIKHKNSTVSYTKSAHHIFALWIIHAPLFVVFLFDFAPFFCLEIHTLQYFGAVASLHVPFLGILQVLRGLLTTYSLSLSNPYRIYQAFMGEFAPKINSCINLVALWKVSLCKDGVHLTCC